MLIREMACDCKSIKIGVSYIDQPLIAMFALSDTTGVMIYHDKSSEAWNPG